MSYASGKVVNDLRDSDCFNANKVNDKATMKLELDVWKDGSGKAKVNDKSLMEFIKMADKTDRAKIVSMLRDAAEAIETGKV